MSGVGSIDSFLGGGYNMSHDGPVKKDSAVILQGTVASWYVAIKHITLVMLLSVLVYIGIRVLIASTGESKAKYKAMLMNWLVAVCIVFVLQFVMAFILNLTGELTNILKAKVVDDNGTDFLMTMCRLQNEENVDFSDKFVDLVIYIGLVTLTTIFTFQYLKRLAYMAFLTLIAPLIAFTYPIDKIKDSQAQAFSMWLKEYTFNALLQPMHLLLYYIFISSAIELSEMYPLYAIVALYFLTRAEKFFRTMFGFDKAKTSGKMGGAAAAALAASALTKLSSKGQDKKGAKAGDAAGADSADTPAKFSTPNRSADSYETTQSQLRARRDDDLAKYKRNPSDSFGTRFSNWNKRRKTNQTYRAKSLGNYLGKSRLGAGVVNLAQARAAQARAAIARGKKKLPKKIIKGATGSLLALGGVAAGLGARIYPG